MAPKMIITRIEAFPLPIPFKAGSQSDASAWGRQEPSDRGTFACQSENRQWIGRLGSKEMKP
jgi:hypothetical protein